MLRRSVSSPGSHAGADVLTVEPPGQARGLARLVWPLALGAVVLAAVAAYAVAGRFLHGPSVPGDELVYMDAARSLGNHGTPLVRGEPYGYGLLYPASLVPAVRLASTQLDVYALVKVTNAILFALAAVPVYALGRRILSRPWSLAVAVLAIAIPSSMYTGLVFTENAAYPLAETAFLAIALMLERPTTSRQLFAVGAVGMAIVARPQFILLAAVMAAALLLRWTVTGLSRNHIRSVRRLWPTIGSGTLGIAVLLAVAAARGVSPLGDYATVVRSYDPVEVAKSAWYSLANLELYLGFVPFVVAPSAIALLLRRGRTGSASHAAFVALFAAANVLVVLEVAALMTTPLLGGLLHDRYLFYLVPLWLVLFAAWVEARGSSARAWIALGGALAVVLAATLPLRLIVGESARIDALGTAVWVAVRDHAPAHPALVRLAMVAVAVAVTAAVWLLGRRGRALLLVPVAGLFVANSILVWRPRVVDADRPVFARRSPDLVSWADRLLPPGAQATTLWISGTPCPEAVRDAYIWTEFFDARVLGAAHVGESSFSPVGSVQVTVGRDGSLRRSDGRLLRADYVIVPPGVALRGRVLGRGTTSRLRLWRVAGRVVVVDATSDAGLAGAACNPAA